MLCIHPEKTLDSIRLSDTKQEFHTNTTLAKHGTSVQSVFYRNYRLSNGATFRLKYQPGLCICKPSVRIRINWSEVYRYLHIQNRIFRFCRYIFDIPRES